jgi:hypothetical protein
MYKIHIHSHFTSLGIDFSLFLFAPAAAAPTTTVVAAAKSGISYFIEQLRRF